MGWNGEIRRTEDVRPCGSGLAEHVRRGDPTAFNDLFHAHYEALCRYACCYVHSPEVAEDLVQDVFFDLWKRRCSWHPERSAKAFLFGAVRNQTLNFNRRVRAQNYLRRHDAADRLSSRENPEQALQYTELARVAQRAISDLPERRRQIFILSREHDLTYAEIATTLEISVKTVETQMGRALRQLRGRLRSQLSPLRL